MKTFSVEELAEYNGKDGKPCYIAYQGKVYDVSESRLWKLGVHMKRHAAGNDLTKYLQAAPHEPDVLSRYPQIGTLRKTPMVEPRIPQFLSKLIKRYPMLRRHPHPMTVHFPIVLMFSTTVFNLLYLITGIRSFETTALNCLGGGVLFIAVATGTGFYTWWMNYLLRPVRAVTIKRRVAIILLIVAIIVFIWRITNPNVLNDIDAGSVLYLLLVLSLAPLVTVNGWFGASLTFPYEKE
ncbi:MAG: cytochrome b5 [Deltaproteobacteria bacterium]|nr:cytochrome b5 [Deltaproteobacteria bacterium]MBW2151516.1 cytochrome b5 [Deltaproteobacteria bacterium]